MNSDVLDEILDLWYDWKAIPFPRSVAGLDIIGIDFVMVDADSAGCISSFIRNRGHLDPDTVLVLQECADDLAIVVPELDGEAWDYFKRLQILANRVLLHHQSLTES